jgi:hypothetical protein
VDQYGSRGSAPKDAGAVFKLSSIGDRRRVQFTFRDYRRDGTVHDGYHPQVAGGLAFDSG